MNFTVFSGYFQGIFKKFQGIFRVFSGCFSLCPFRVCPLAPSKRMLAGVLPKIGVLWAVLARVPTEVSMKESSRKSTFVSTLRSTLMLESTPASILGSYLGVFPFPASLPGHEVPYA